MSEQFSQEDVALLRLATIVHDSGYSFTTVTPETHARVNRRPGAHEAGDLRGVFGWSRPFRAGLLPPALLEAMEAAKVVDREGDRLRSRVRFSTFDEKLFIHSAFPTTAPDSVFFGPDTYRTVWAVLDHLRERPEPPRRVVEVGCGTGAAAIAVASRCPSAEVIGVDINDAALRFARLNAALAGTPGFRAVHSDLLTAVSGEFDLVVSNPPFMIDPVGRTYRDGGQDGLGLPLAVADAAVERLAPGGTLVMFSGTAIVDGADPLREALRGRFGDWAGTYREVDPDVYDEELDTPAYAHAERIALAVLTVTRPA
jgi:methylase of polypeptide subunit release factors